MPDPIPIALCWSGGKDSSLAWHKLMSDDRYSIQALVTTLTEDYDRVSMHGVRRALVQRQAACMELPLEEVWIPAKANNAVYESRMAETLSTLRDTAGIRHVAFGDIFLEDLRVYREKQLQALDMSCVFPLWRQNTRELATEFVQSGFRGMTCCIDPSRLDSSFIGREMNEQFFAQLPADCDPCGENGEFHSFVSFAPGWKSDIPVSPGEIVQRDSFLFRDLLPLSSVT